MINCCAQLHDGRVMKSFEKVNAENCVVNCKKNCNTEYNLKLVTFNSNTFVLSVLCPFILRHNLPATETSSYMKVTFFCVHVPGIHQDI